MPYRLPRHFPALQQLAADVAPSPRELAAWLGVSERSAQRWMAEDRAPRPVLAALWLASRWGMSDLEAERQQAAQLAQALAGALQAENGRLRAALARLAPLARAGAANEPLGPAFDLRAQPVGQVQGQQSAGRQPDPAPAVHSSA